LHVLVPRRPAGERGPQLLVRLARDLDLPVAWRQPGAQPPASAFAALRALLDVLPQVDLFRVAAALEAGAPVDPDVHPELRPLTWEQVRALHRAGMTIGSHTRTHALLTHEDAATLQAELAGSRRDLERELGVVVEHFAYPDGRFDDDALDAVGAAGYRFAYTTCAHRHPPPPLPTIPRRMLWGAACVGVRGRFSGPVMSCQAAGVFGPGTRCAHG